MAIEWWSIAWMALEAALSLAAAVTAGSISLAAFGVDSVVEILSAGTVLRRLGVEYRGADPETVERAERTASGIVGTLLLLLALAVAIGAARALILRVPSGASLPGILVAAAASVIMPIIARRKRRIASAIGSSALRGDAACSMVCAYMSLTLLAGLALRALFGWWWADPVAALGLVYFIAHEGWEAIEVARGETDSCC